jgi:hypothetical protein
MGILRAFSGLRVAGLLLMSAAMAGCGIAYGLFVVGQQQYLTGRNFRLLSTLSRQFDNTVRAEARIIEGLARAENTGNTEFSWPILRQRRYSTADVLPDSVPHIPGAVAEYRYEGPPAVRLHVLLRRPADKAPAAEAFLTLERLLAPILTPKIEQGAFDTIVLANGDGDVLFARGRRVLELESSGLGALFPAGADKEAPQRSFGERARTTSVEDVSIADVGYKLFMQPCCAPTVRDEKPLVMVGLIQSSVLRSQSWAISTTVVKLAVMLMLLVLIGWPFLKLWLIGDRQQVRVADLFQLGVSSVAGLAIVTIVLLDVAAYWQLNRHRDAHLRRLAEALDRHATREVAAAQRQLACLERHTTRYSAQQGATFRSVLEQTRYACSPDDAPQARGSDAGGAGTVSAAGRTTEWAYPFFETFSLIDESGAQRIKLATTDWVPSQVDVSERPYFKAAAAGRGWTHETMCPGPERCTLESIWSWTTGEPEAVLARRSSTAFKVATIAIPMRSLIRPVLPPGFEFAVIDRTGRVLFHSDRRRNVSENFFEEADDNRRLRAQVGAHSEEPLNLRYWGASYRAYVKPMALPDTYVVAMYQKQRAWAINREWLVVALVFLTGYLGLWLVVALATLLPDASWVWPDPVRRTRYYGVIALHSAVILVAVLTAWNGDRNRLLLQACVLPLAGWAGTFLLLRKRPAPSGLPSNEPVAAYSFAAVLLLFVSGVLPGALLFLASFQIHMQSYIKNSQLVVANALSSRVERLSNEYEGGRQTARKFVGRLADDDLYFGFVYDTCIREQEESSCPGTAVDAALAAKFQSGSHLEPESRSGTHEDDMVLGMLEDYLPYYSEASVEWRELLHDHADDGSWDSETTPDGRLILELKGRGGHDGPVVVSTVPSLLGLVTPGPRELTPVVRAEQAAPESRPVATSGRDDSPAPPPDAPQGRAVLLLILAAAAAVSLTWAIVYTLMRRVFLVGVTEPLWVTAGLAANAGDNIFVRRDEKTRGQQIKGTLPLKLGAIVRQVSAGRRTPRQRDEEVQLMWRKALIELDRRDRAGAAVLVDDFDEDLDDAALMERKLTLLEELVADPSRTVILVSQVSPTGLGDSLRGSGGGGSATGSPAERWRRLVGAFTVVDWRGIEEPVDGATLSVEVPAGEGPGPADLQPSLHEGPPAAPWWKQTGPRLAALRAAPVRDLLNTEGRAHPFVHRVCADLLESEAVRTGRLTREQAFDEIGERAHHCYRRIWESCSDDQKVVLGHIAQHGLANASARTVVRRLLGRRLLHKDPALRPMNETFRRFVLSKRCRLEVARAEASAEPSAWDRLRMPLAVAVVGVGVFLFATQKELYNAILGVTTAAAVSVPTLIRTVSMLAGRRSPEGESAKA